MHLTMSDRNRDAKCRHSAWHVGSAQQRLALLTSTLLMGVGVVPLLRNLQAFCSDCHGGPFPCSDFLGSLMPFFETTVDKYPSPALPPQAPSLPTAWLASSSSNASHGRAGSERGWAPHCYSWHEVILPASSEAHKNIHSLSFTGAAQSPVAPSEKTVLPAAFWEQLLPRMVWYVRGRGSACELK